METSKLIQKLNNVTLIYATRDGLTTFTCVPTSMLDKVLDHRLYKNDWSQYFGVDPLTQVSFTGDGVVRDFSAGETLFNSDTALSFRLVNQERIENDKHIEIDTYFENNNGIKFKHIVNQVKGYDAFEIYAEVTNCNEARMLEKINSFTIGGLSPFQKKNDPETLVLHKLVCSWSNEARLFSLPLSKLYFEDSWSALGIRVDRIGELGLMPARGYHPFIALEDTKNNVTWAIQLAAADSWEMETIFRYGGISLTGGHADYLFGHFRKNLGRNDTFITNKAYVSVVNDGLTKACANLTKYHDNLLHVAESEEELPVVYNEYLHSWGNPTIENIIPQLDVAKDLGCEYFVIDAGWFKNEDESWEAIGDWNVSKTAFPNGLKEFANLCDNKGYKAYGIWYEFEGVTDTSNVFKEHPDWLLTLDGYLIKRNNRYLLDFRKKEVTDYLKEKVIDQLNENGLTYIKIDYNENVGFGVDGEESIGEGLRHHANKVVEFYQRLTKEVKGLVMETCSSGGMRHEITYDTIGSMVSFSDAHETTNGAIIAMDMHRIMQPKTMQIWASILPKFDNDEVYFTMAKSMLGRICISGQIDRIDDEKKKIIKEGTKFYQEIKDVIKNGETTLIDTSESKSVINPAGVVKLVRVSNDNKKMVCYAFSYNTVNRSIEFDSEGYKLTHYYGNAKIENNNVVFEDNKLSCAVLVYERS